MFGNLIPRLVTPTIPERNASIVSKMLRTQNEPVTTCTRLEDRKPRHLYESEQRSDSFPEVDYAPDFFSILAQESLRGRVRLKTRRAEDGWEVEAAVESLSTQK